MEITGEKNLHSQWFNVGELEEQIARIIAGACQSLRAEIFQAATSRELQRLARVFEDRFYGGRGFLSLTAQRCACQQREASSGNDVPAQIHA